MDSKLVYLKEKFLSNFNLFVFENNSTNTPGQFEAIKEFNASSVHFRNSILHAETKEELVEVLNEVRADYLTHWSSSFHKQNDTHLYSKFYGLFFGSGINNIDEWVKNTEQMYEDQLKFDYFNKAQVFLGISKTPEEKLVEMVEKANNIENNFELKALTKKLIEKYNLCHIDLSAVEDSEQALKFLKKFDKETQQVAKDMNMPNEYIGINGTLSIAYNSTNQAFYQTAEKNMSFGNMTTSKSTILHEWIHALDNYICNEHLSVNGYVSHNKGILVEETNTTASKAYHAMRKITQDIFNSNEKEVDKIVEKNMRSGLCKFWSVMLGDQWYAISKEDRETYFTKDIQKLVLNYLSNPTNGIHACDMELTIRKKGNFTSSSKVLAIMDENLDYIQENVAPHFRNVSQNIIGKKSFYFHTANISNVHIIAEVFIKGIVNKVKDALNLPPSQETKTNIESGYFIEPCEMVARYFESQVYTGQALMFNVLGLVGAYKMNKESDFEQKKDNLLNAVFNKEKTMSKIGNLRGQYHPSHTTELKPT